MTECPHSDDQATCPVCQNPPTTWAPPVEEPLTATARFPSTLACGHDVEPGDTITMTGGTWVCDLCAEDWQ